MNILFLTPRLPYPIIGGDRIKPYKLLSHLAKNHKVTLVSFYQGRDDFFLYIKELEKLGIEVIVIPLNPVIAGLSCLLRLPLLKPLEILYYNHHSFQKKVDELFKTRKFDLSFSFFMRTAEYLKNKPIKKVLLAEDCRILYQTRSYYDSKNIFQKLIRFYEHKTLENYEPKIIDNFNCTTFVTNEDISYIKSIKPNTSFSLISNGTDTNIYVPSEFNKRKTILFTGKLDLWANKLMMERIVYSIMPIVRKEFPEITLTFVGAKATKWIKSLQSNNELILLENVPSFVPYLQTARVYLHPHLGASGIQNKLLEAMSSGCPVVTTNSGNQGIYGVHREHLMIGTSNEEIAGHVIELLQDRELSEKISKNARELIVKTHSWEKIYEDLDQLISELQVHE